MNHENKLASFLIMPSLRSYFAKLPKAAAFTIQATDVKRTVGHGRLSSFFMDA